MHTLAASQGVQASEAAVCQPSRVVASSVRDATRCGAAAATLHATKPARSESHTEDMGSLHSGLLMMGPRTACAGGTE